MNYLLALQREWANEARPIAEKGRPLISMTPGRGTTPTDHLGATGPFGHHHALQLYTDIISSLAMHKAFDKQHIIRSDDMSPSVTSLTAVISN